MRLHCPRAQRVAVVSDTHGQLDPRIAELVAGCDCAVHAGDIGGAEVLAALRPKGPLVAVRGNNDLPAKWPADQHSLLRGLPEEARLSLPGGELLVLHGHRAGPVRSRHQWLRDRYPQVRAVVYGHSHRLVCDLSARPWVLNPGAAGRARTYGGPSCLLLAVRDRRWTAHEIRFEPLPRSRSRRHTT
jgi:putative phosphoesterase